MPTVKNVWISDNKKYKVSARKFEDDDISEVVVGYWKLNKYGKTVDVLKKDLPQYVLNKITKMRKEAYKK